MSDDFEGFAPKESGFEDDPIQLPCTHSEHDLPRHLVIPQGKVYRHVCPKCFRTVRVSSSGLVF